MATALNGRIPIQWEAHGVFAIQLFSPQECATILDSVRKLDRWERAEVNRPGDEGADVAAAAFEARSASVLGPELAPWLWEEFHGKVDSLVKPLLHEIWQLDLTDHSGTQLVRYGPGGHYLPHTDSGQDSLDRYFTVLCYLNSAFSGGHTSFPSLGHRAAPEPGKAIVFPAKFLHCAEPVLAGEKFILLTWICGPLPVNWI